MSYTTSGLKPGTKERPSALAWCSGHVSSRRRKPDEPGVGFLADGDALPRHRRRCTRLAQVLGQQRVDQRIGAAIGKAEVRAEETLARKSDSL
jgi:hypothetical protein